MKRLVTEIDTNNNDTGQWNGRNQTISSMGHSIFTRSLLLKIFSIRISVCVQQRSGVLGIGCVSVYISEE